MSKRRTSPLETDEQRALAAQLDAAGLRWCHVPNGGVRHKATAGRMKAEGVKAGVPDVLIFDRPPTRIDAAGAFIELKRADGVPSDVSDVQAEWMTALVGRGWVGAVAYGADDALKYLRTLGYRIAGCA